MRKLLAGNWKMHGSASALSELTAIGSFAQDAGCEVVLCLPATLMDRARQEIGMSALGLGGQDCHTAESGAHTGDISAEMLADAGARYVIIGHSERRTDHAETDTMVRDKVLASRRAGLSPILCVGETFAEREAGRAAEVITRQIAEGVPADDSGQNLVVAYEPVWAIGTGVTANEDQIAEIHNILRTLMIDRFGEEAGGAIRLLYGGSVKPENAKKIFQIPNVDGALVGGASLKAESFRAIAEAI